MIIIAKLSTKDIPENTYFEPIEFTIDKTVFEEYRKWYFKKYPRRSKLDVLPTAISLNKFTSMTRLAQNNSKEKHGEFYLWCLNYLNIPKANYTSCEMFVTFHWKDRRARDYDNAAIFVKYFNDKATEYGLLYDDNNHILKELHFNSDYIKSDMSSVTVRFEAVR